MLLCQFSTVGTVVVVLALLLCLWQEISYNLLPGGLSRESCAGPGHSQSLVCLEVKAGELNGGVRFLLLLPTKPTWSLDRDRPKALLELAVEEEEAPPPPFWHRRRVCGTFCAL